MSRGINKVILVGRLGQSPEVRYSAQGTAVCNLSLATGESWKDKNTGQAQERTEWHRIVLYGKLAEVAGQYLSKGSKVYIEGKLQTREWERDGIKRYTTEVVVDMQGRMQMLDSKGVNLAQNSRPAPQQQPAPAAQVPPQDLGWDMADDHVPF